MASGELLFGEISFVRRSGDEIMIKGRSLILREYEEFRASPCTTHGVYGNENVPVGGVCRPPSHVRRRNPRRRCTSPHARRSPRASRTARPDSLSLTSTPVLRRTERFEPHRAPHAQLRPPRRPSLAHTPHTGHCQCSLQCHTATRYTDTAKSSRHTSSCQCTRGSTPHEPRQIPSALPTLLRPLAPTSERRRCLPDPRHTSLPHPRLYAPRAHTALWHAHAAGHRASDEIGEAARCGDNPRAARGVKRLLHRRGRVRRQVDEMLLGGRAAGPRVNAP